MLDKRKKLYKRERSKVDDKFEWEELWSSEMYERDDMYYTKKSTHSLTQQIFRHIDMKHQASSSGLMAEAAAEELDSIVIRRRVSLLVEAQIISFLPSRGRLESSPESLIELTIHDNFTH